jgi:hypothetical protein
MCRFQLSWVWQPHLKFACSIRPAVCVHEAYEELFKPSCPSYWFVALSLQGLGSYLLSMCATLDLWLCATFFAQAVFCSGPVLTIPLPLGLPLTGCACKAATPMALNLDACDDLGDLLRACLYTLHAWHNKHQRPGMYVVVPRMGVEMNGWAVV